MRLSEAVADLSICVDCYYWAHYGWEEGANYPEGWEGPTHSLLLSAHYVDAITGESYYSSRECEGCGESLVGDRVAVAIYVLEEEDSE